MRTKKTIETATCDVCGKECKPIVLIAITAGFAQNKQAVFKQFHFDARNDEDICEPCLRNLLQAGPVAFTTETE